MRSPRTCTSPSGRSWLGSRSPNRSSEPATRAGQAPVRRVDYPGNADSPDHARRAWRRPSDPLTKLANRAAFDEHLTIALARADRDGAAVGVVYIDLDGFKEINDRYGHAAGDELLEAVAGRLTSHRHSNDVIARIGGDEFLLLLADLEPRAGRETLAAIATRIQGAIATPIRLPRHGMVGISSSVGTSLYPNDAVTAAELVAAADRALYRRKRAA